VQAIGSLITGLQSRQPAHGRIKRSAALQPSDSVGASKQPRFAVGVGVLHLAFPFQDDPCPALAGLSFLAGGTNRRAAELL
jgi:hypothetical protein